MRVGKHTSAGVWLGLGCCLLTLSQRGRACGACGRRVARWATCKVVHGKSPGAVGIVHKSIGLLRCYLAKSLMKFENFSSLAFAFFRAESGIPTYSPATLTYSFSEGWNRTAAASRCAVAAVAAVGNVQDAGPDVTGIQPKTSLYHKLCASNSERGFAFLAFG